MVSNSNDAVVGLQDLRNRGAYYRNRGSTWIVASPMVLSMPTRSQRNAHSSAHVSPACLDCWWPPVSLGKPQLPWTGCDANLEDQTDHKIGALYHAVSEYNPTMVYPAGPSTQYLGSLVPSTIKGVVFGTRDL